MGVSSYTQLVSCPILVFWKKIVMVTASLTSHLVMHLVCSRQCVVYSVLTQSVVCCVQCALAVNDLQCAIGGDGQARCCKSHPYVTKLFITFHKPLQILGFFIIVENNLQTSGLLQKYKILLRYLQITVTLLNTVFPKPLKLD